MLKVMLSSAIALHGIIHLMGFVREWDLGPVGKFSSQKKNFTSFRKVKVCRCALVDCMHALADICGWILLRKRLVRDRCDLCSCDIPSAHFCLLGCGEAGNNGKSDYPVLDSFCSHENQRIFRYRKNQIAMNRYLVAATQNA